MKKITVNAFLLSKTLHPSDALIYHFFTKELGVVSAYLKNSDVVLKTNISSVLPLIQKVKIDLNRGNTYFFINDISIVNRSDSSSENLRLSLWGKIFASLIKPDQNVDGIWQILDSQYGTDSESIVCKIGDILSKLGFVDLSENCEGCHGTQKVFGNEEILCKNCNFSEKNHFEVSLHEVGEVNIEKIYLNLCLDLLGWKRSRFDKLL